MSLKIGRATDFPLTAMRESLTFDGTRMQISGRLPLSNVIDAKTARMQYLGLLDSRSEKYVPIIFDEDPRLSGFWAPVSIDVDIDRGGLARGYFPYRMSFDAHPQRAMPMFESQIIGALRPYRASDWDVDLGAGGSYLWHAVPAASRHYEVNGVAPQINRATGATSNQRKTATGNLWFVKSGIVNGSIARWFAVPANHYDGAATIYCQDENNAWRTITGREIPLGWEDQWRISNGLIRATYSATVGYIDIEVWDANSASWESLNSWAVTSDSTNFRLMQGWQSLTVVQNTPERVVIRLSTTFLTSATDEILNPVTLDLTLRRGARMVEIVASGSALRAWGVKRSAASAATQQGGTTDASGTTAYGMTQTAADGSGNKWDVVSFYDKLALTPVANSITWLKWDLVNATAVMGQSTGSAHGTVSTLTSPTFTLAIGAYLTSAGSNNQLAVSPEDAHEYAYAVAEFARAVQR